MLNLFMALLSFRGISTPSVYAEGEQRRSSFFNIGRDIPTNYANYLENAITILDTPVLSIDLPTKIVAAIDQKIEQFYKIQEYQYRAEREVEESKRKQIEANGIAAFQRTVSQGISDSYLRWQGIQATLALAQSPNTKIVIIGNGKGGLPIILGNLDTALPANPTEKPSEGATAPDSSKPSGTPPTGCTPAAPESEPKTNSSGGPGGPASPAKQPSSSLDLSDIKAIISRLSGALRTTGSEKSSATPANPK